MLENNDFSLNAISYTSTESFRVVGGNNVYPKNYIPVLDSSGVVQMVSVYDQLNQFELDALSSITINGSSLSGTDSEKMEQIRNFCCDPSLFKKDVFFSEGTVILSTKPAYVFGVANAETGTVLTADQYEYDGAGVITTSLYGERVLEVVYSAQSNVKEQPIIVTEDSDIVPLWNDRVVIVKDNVVLTATAAIANISGFSFQGITKTASSVEWQAESALVFDQAPKNTRENGGFFFVIEKDTNIITLKQ